MNFDDLPEGPRASARILAFVIALALLVLAMVGVSMLLASAAKAASLEEQAAEVCRDGCVVMSRADYETMRGAARRCPGVWL